MKQVELAESLGVSKAYISMVLSGKKQPSKRVADRLRELGVNQKVNQIEAKSSILSHARLPIPTLPHESQFSVVSLQWLVVLISSQLRTDNHPHIVPEMCARGYSVLTGA